MRCATTRTLSRVSVFTRDAGPRTVTDTRSGDKRNPVKPEAAVVIGTPPIERSMIAVTSPAIRTVLGEIRTTPRGVVSIGTVWKKGPLTLEITVGSVVTESSLVRLCSGPTRRGPRRVGGAAPSGRTTPQATLFPAARAP